MKIHRPLANISVRKLLALTIVTSGALAWFFVILNNYDAIFPGIAETPMTDFIGRALFFGFGAISAIIGTVISGKFDRRKFLAVWVFFGIAANLALIFFHGEIAFYVLNTLLGISLGFGFPASAALFANRTDVGERGRAAGVLMLETFLMVFVALALSAIFVLDSTMTILLCVAVRAVSLLGLVLDSSKIEVRPEKTWRAILRHRDFILYLLPWIMFNMASGLTKFVTVGLENMPQANMVVTMSGPLQFGSTALACLFSGFIADRYGRKNPIIIGVVLFGVSFAVLAFDVMYITVLIHWVITGFAWGFLMVVYIAIPGDLAAGHGQERLYAFVTMLPLVVFMEVSSLPNSFYFDIPTNLLSPILSIILFMSIAPILYAKETLPQKQIQARKLQEHIDKVGKLIEEANKE